MEKEIKNPKPLSNVLSTAVLQAVEDLEAIKQNDNYLIDFGTWHRPVKNQFEVLNKCSVCFAGSVMANRLGSDIEKLLNPDDFPEAQQRVLQALDAIRKGLLGAAINKVYGQYPKEEIQDIDVNQEDYPTFVKQMEEISELLKSKGY